MGSKTYWYDTPYLWFWLFNVGTNQASMVWTPHRYVVIIDCGATDDFSPFEEIIPRLSDRCKTYGNPYDGKKYIPESIAQLIVSHPHEDHITEFARYFESEQGSIPLNPYYVTCPYNKRKGKADEFDYSKCSPEALRGDLLKSYRTVADGPRETPLRIITPGEGDTDRVLDLDLGLYFMQPGHLEEENDFDYVNAASLVYYIRYGMNRLLIPGDITNNALKQILNDAEGSEKRYSVFGQNRNKNHIWYRQNADQPKLKRSLESGLSVLIAPHHGSDSDIYFPDVLFRELGVKPQIVLASEEVKTGGKAGGISPRYSDKNLVQGHDIYIDGKIDRERKLVSTINGHIAVIISSGEICIKQTHEDIEYLLTLEV